jgi:cytochrome c-type biogenesis protein CcmH
MPLSRPALVLVFALLVASVHAEAARQVTPQQVHDVAEQLRCVVCQNLSVADSPSEMAAQMRAIVRERLASGESPAQVRQYFLDKYGEWILLEPQRHGFTLLVWLAPVVAVAIGLVLFVVLVRRWTRARRRTAVPVPSVDPAMRERIQRELDREAQR